MTYAANWDEYKRVVFWDDLDFIGIDAYFPLSDLQSPTIEDFEMGWKNHKQVIFDFHLKFDKPILFTEFGYRSSDFNGKEPWAANRFEGKINQVNQENGLQAIHNQFWKEEWFCRWFYLEMVSCT